MVNNKVILQSTNIMFGVGIDSMAVGNTVLSTFCSSKIFLPILAKGDKQKMTPLLELRGQKDPLNSQKDPPNP